MQNGSGHAIKWGKPLQALGPCLWLVCASDRCKVTPSYATPHSCEHHTNACIAETLTVLITPATAQPLSWPWVSTR